MHLGCQFQQTHSLEQLTGVVKGRPVKTLTNKERHASTQANNEL